MSQTSTYRERREVPLPPPESPISPVQPAVGFATTALVLGILGTLFGLIPLLFFLAIPLGILAIVFGLIAARRNKRARSHVGMARTGWLLGVAALTLGIVGIAIIDDAVDDLNDDLNGLEIEPS